MKLINWFLILLMDIRRYFSFKNDYARFRGVYTSFEEATKGVKTLKGYDEDEVVDLCLVKFGEHNKKIADYEYPIFLWLIKIFSEMKKEDEIKIFDFGGRFGGHFFRFVPFVLDYKFSWLVCEVEKMALMGKAKFENEQLKFTSSFKDAENSDIFLSSGAIQYVEDLSLSLSLLTNKPRYVLLTRIPMQDKVKKFVTLQNQGIAFVPQYVFNQNDFVHNMYDAGYDLVDEWDDSTANCVIPFHRDISAFSYTGLYFKLRDE